MIERFEKFTCYKPKCKAEFQTRKRIEFWGGVPERSLPPVDWIIIYYTRRTPIIICPKHIPKALRLVDA